MSITAQDLNNHNNSNLDSINATHKQHQEFLQAAKQAGLANVFQAKNWLAPDPLTVLREKYINGPANQKSAARAQVFVMVADFRNLDGAILSFLLKGVQKGFKGTAMTLEQIAECVEVTTGRKCSVRSVQRCLSKYEALGLIRLAWMPTGGKILNSKGKWICLHRHTHAKKAYNGTQDPRECSPFRATQLSWGLYKRQYNFRDCRRVYDF